MAGSSTARTRSGSPSPAAERSPSPPVQARFYYDFASAKAYLAAEQVNAALGAVPEWVPVALGPPAFRCQAEVDAHREDVERRARAIELQALRWPAEFPPESDWALLAATYAKSIGRAV